MQPAFHEPPDTPAIRADGADAGQNPMCAAREQLQALAHLGFALSLRQDPAAKRDHGVGAQHMASGMSRRDTLGLRGREPRRQQAGRLIFEGGSSTSAASTASG